MALESLKSSASSAAMAHCGHIKFQLKLVFYLTDEFDWLKELINMGDHSDCIDVFSTLSNT